MHCDAAAAPTAAYKVAPMSETQRIVRAAGEGGGGGGRGGGTWGTSFQCLLLWQREAGTKRLEALACTVSLNTLSHSAKFETPQLLLQYRYSGT